MQFVRPEKPKDEKQAEVPPVHRVRELTAEQRNDFRFKYPWVVEILHALRKSDPRPIDRALYQRHRENVRGSEPDFLRKTILEAEENLIKQHRPFYEAITDEIHDAKLNRKNL